jgi:tight adherence protein B
MAYDIARRVDRTKDRSIRHHIDERVRTRMHAAGVDLRWSPSVLLITAAGSAVALGARLAGAIGIASGVVLVAISLSAGAHVVQTKTRERSQRALPELTLRMTRGVRSGQPIDRVVDTVASEMTPLPGGFEAMVTQVSSGRPMFDALGDWGSNASSSGERLLVGALLIGVKHGGDLAHTLDMVGEGIRDDLELAERRRVLLMHSTMSALVLVLLPIGFSIVASLVRGEVMYGGILGGVLLASGLTLDVLGLLWMRALMRRLR